MNLTGKYRVEITDKNGNKRYYQTNNSIVYNGVRQVLDWLSFDVYGSNSFQGMKKIPSNEIYFPENNSDTPTSMDYPDNIMDYEDIDNSDYYYDSENPVDLKNYSDYEGNKNNTFATIDKFRDGALNGWNEQSITLCFKEGAVMLSAINLDAQMLSYPGTKNNEDISFEIKYREINDVKWKNLPCDYTLCNDGKRRNVTFFVCPNVPPFVFLPCTALKFTFKVKKNTLSEENNLIGKIYNISLFKAHYSPQPPAVMKFGSGKLGVQKTQTNLEKFEYSQVVSYVKKSLETGTVSYVVEIPRDKCNNIEISEIGMFYRYDYVNPSQQHIKQSVKNTNEMFSRALFETPWKKTPEDEIVIAYDITVDNGTQESFIQNSSEYLF